MKYLLIWLLLFSNSLTAQNNNCSNATLVCNTTVFNGNSNGSGTQELNAGNRGCLILNEHQSSWYLINVVANGTLRFIISPTTATDYDFALYGPNTSCNSLGLPLRCSYDAPCSNTGTFGGSCFQTGLNPNATVNSEGAAGNGYVDTVQVFAGQFYYLLVDNFTANTQPFTLDFTGTTNGSLGCVSLPIQLLEFNGKEVGLINQLNWKTLNEVNCLQYFIERSVDLDNFEVIGQVYCNNQTSLNSYLFNDSLPVPFAYYRIRQQDFDGLVHYSNIVEIVRVNESFPLVYPNPTTGILHIENTLETEVIVYDITGRVVYIRNIENNQVNLSFLSNGLYFVRIGNLVVKINLNTN